MFLVIVSTVVHLSGLCLLILCLLPPLFLILLDKVLDQIKLRERILYPSACPYRNYHGKSLIIILRATVDLVSSLLLEDLASSVFFFHTQVCKNLVCSSDSVMRGHTSVRDQALRPGGGPVSCLFLLVLCCSRLLVASPVLDELKEHSAASSLVHGAIFILRNTLVLT